MAKKTRKKALSKNEIISKAIQILDKEGVGALSMRKLASSLNIEAMSLYYHFKNKDKLLDSIVDYVFGKITWTSSPSSQKPWQTEMKERAFALREVLLQHSWAIGLLESRKEPGERTLIHHEQVLACLDRAGFSTSQKAKTYSLMDSYIYGFVLQEVNIPISNEENMPEVASEIMSGVPKDLFPNLHKIATEYVMQEGYSYSNEFVYGLDLILDAIFRKQNNKEN